MDFPQNQVLPISVGSWSRFSPLIDSRGVLGAISQASIAWPAANLGIYIPMWLPFSYPVRRLFWANGSSATGEMDIGLYSRDGAKIYSSGPTAQSGATALQYVTVSTDLILPAGAFYLGISNNGTTNRTLGSSGVTTNEGRVLGLLQQASVATLPASATFAQWASTGYPLCGITRTSTGF